MNKDQVVILDYGCGNIDSIINIIEHIGGCAIASNDISIIRQYNKIILPGVGHFSAGMNSLKNSGLIEILNEKKAEGAYIMGICLGMQLMTNYSEEGKCEGLGWFDFETKKFPDISPKLQKVLVPHMGWNKVKLVEKECPLLEDDNRFYFVHSYFVDGANKDNCLTVSHYGELEFASGINRGNVFGFQFHPEKSHKNGMHLFKEFLKL